MTVYDAIGTTYTSTRRPDPRIGARIAAALGDAGSVINVGAGAGSYETSRVVLAVEPSPVMIAQRSGVILNNSSIAGLRGMARLSHYTASKWGLTGLTKAWAIELAPYGIRVNSIHPTGVNTPMNDGLAAMEGMTPQEIAERSAGNLLPVPWVEPEDVANAAVFLASDQARYMTGAQFVVDAGLLTR